MILRSWFNITAKKRLHFLLVHLLAAHSPFKSPTTMRAPMMSITSAAVALRPQSLPPQRNFLILSIRLRANYKLRPHTLTATTCSSSSSSGGGSGAGGTFLRP